MLDKFQGLHSRVVFSSRTRLRLDPDTLVAASSAAAKPIDSPDLSLLETSVDTRRIEIIYELALTRELEGITNGLRGVQSRLVEVVLLQRFRNNLPEDAFNQDPFKRQRIVATLGSMEQQRFTHLLLNIREDQFDQIINVGKSWGMSRREWEISLAGAASAAKTIMELANSPDIDIYMSTVMEDVLWSIDLFIELKDGSTGACISIKTLVGKRTQFWAKQPSADDGDQLALDWQKVQRGTDAFNQGNGRTWIPVLVGMGKDNGELQNLHHFSNLAAWVRTLVVRLQDQIQEARRTSA